MRAHTLFLVLVACERSESAPPPPVAPPAAKPIEPPPPAPAPLPTASWPRLTVRGFAGMSTGEMAKAAELARRFPGLRIDAGDPPQFEMVGNGTTVATIYHEAKADKVVLEAPGLVTEHGIAVGESLARVLEVKKHRCETLSGYVDSFAKLHVAVRCWVGPHLRYVAHPSEMPPRELESWIRTTSPPITAIYWDRGRHPDF
jgi:hypothetical protein